MVNLRTTQPKVKRNDSENYEGYGRIIKKPNPSVYHKTQPKVKRKR